MSTAVNLVDPAAAVSGVQGFGLGDGLKLVLLLTPGQLVLVHWAEVQLLLPGGETMDILDRGKRANRLFKYVETWICHSIIVVFVSLLLSTNSGGR